MCYVSILIVLVILKLCCDGDQLRLKYTLIGLLQKLWKFTHLCWLEAVIWGLVSVGSGIQVVSVWISWCFWFGRGRCNRKWNWMTEFNWPIIRNAVVLYLVPNFMDQFPYFLRMIFDEVLGNEERLILGSTFTRTVSVRRLEETNLTRKRNLDRIIKRSFIRIFKREVHLMWITVEEIVVDGSELSWATTFPFFIKIKYEKVRPESTFIIDSDKFDWLFNQKVFVLSNSWIFSAGISDEATFKGIRSWRSPESSLSKRTSSAWSRRMETIFDILLWFQKLLFRNWFVWMMNIHINIRNSLRSV